ncbi:MAG: heparinase II/III family protein [Acidobacteriota bacterium]|nr:heparinase II/III family protein [Acidobacteriota bacterium]
MGKLKGRDPQELRVRGAQAFAAGMERRGWSRDARVPDDKFFFQLLDHARMERVPVSAESLLEGFRSRRAPNFFLSFADRDATVTEWRRRFGAEVEEEIIARARRITNGKFDLLGYKNLDFGAPVDWHLEPVSKKRAPLTHWSRINYLDAEVTGDKKIIWELNRHQYFSTLGRAYWLTGDERFAETFVVNLLSWMESNPPKLGINWASNLEVAFRSIAWLWALHFFKDSAHLTPQVFLRALKFLHIHARHLETYLSTYFSPNTHLTGEALGLFYLGTLLPEFRQSARWRATGERILLDELDRHVRPDGVYFEQSSYYHRYTVDFYTHYLLLKNRNGETAEFRVKGKLTALLDHLMYITRPDGTTPFFGDDDGGRLMPLDERAGNNFRAALSNGAAIFSRADYKYVAGEAAEETLWLLGSEGLRAFDQLAAEQPAQNSRGFADGGYYIMRDGWRADANYLLIDCGPHGTANCGHAHADALAFELAARGRTMLVDPGTYTYTGSTAGRDWFRSTAAHNTLTVDGESSSVSDGAFSWKHIARSTLREWITHPRFDYFEGEHDGFMRLEAPALHLRSVLFLKDDYWIVRDRVETTGAHRAYDLHFHFAPGAAPVEEKEDDGVTVVVSERPTQRAGLEMWMFVGGETDGAWRAEEGWISNCYGVRANAPVRVFSAMGAEGTNEFVSFFVPRRASDSSARVQEVEALGGRAFEVLADGEARDHLLIKNHASVSTAHASSDFALSWLRRAGRNEEITEIVAIDGRRIDLNGQKVFDFTERVSFVVARRVGDEWHAETDKVEELRLPTFEEDGMMAWQTSSVEK